MGRVTTPSPAPPAPTSTHGRGNWRSLVISMLIVTSVVFVVVALMPHPAQRDRATVDVARTARQLAAERGWPLATVRTGADWHATYVALRPDGKGVPTWEVGYHHRPGDDRYITLAQTRVGDGVTAEQLAPWIDRQTSGGRDDGTVAAGGATWTHRTARLDGSQPRTQRSLVAQGREAPGGLVTVLSGEVDDADLESFAASLEHQPVDAGTPSRTAAQPSASDAPAAAPSAPRKLRSAPSSQAAQ